MRRMRDFSRPHLFLGLLAVGITVPSVYYFLSSPAPDSPSGPSLSKSHEPDPRTVQEKLASEGNLHRTPGKRSQGGKGRTHGHPDRLAPGHEEQLSRELASEGSAHGHEASSETGAYSKHSATEHHLESPTQEIASGLLTAGQDLRPSCGVQERWGASPDQVHVSSQDWDQTMDLYHGLKAQYLLWLKNHQTELAPDLVTLLEDRVRTLRIQRPPTLEEPDLAWRGVGAWTSDGVGEPIVRVGGGFPKTLQSDRVRGRFELARLIAQAWAPCELERLKGGKPWAGFIQCLGLDASAGCAEGSYSEAGWAVSTALAAQIADPGCSIPAFKGAREAACVKNILHPPTSAPQPQWKEASR